jgi:spore coat polysaccharide biosynthesis protein SpsF
MLVIIQARHSSERLPGKILKELAGESLLVWTVKRLQRCSLVSEVVVATSADTSDEPTKALCDRLGISCIRGPLDNVAQRFIGVINSLKVEAFMRISGDSPLIDPILADEAIEIFYAGDYELVTNVMKRTFPKGQSVEILRADTFKKVVDSISDSYDQEHVTSYYYKHPDKFKILNIESGLELGHLQLSVDTEEDFLIMKELLTKVDPATVTWQRLVSELQILNGPESLDAKDSGATTRSLSQC